MMIAYLRCHNNAMDQNAVKVEACCMRMGCPPAYISEGKLGLRSIPWEGCMIPMALIDNCAQLCSQQTQGIKYTCNVYTVIQDVISTTVVMKSHSSWTCNTRGHEKKSTRWSGSSVRRNYLSSNNKFSHI